MILVKNFVDQPYILHGTLWWRIYTYHEWHWPFRCSVEDILSPAEDIANKKNLQKDPIKIEKDLTVGVEDSLSPTKDTFNKFDTEAIVKAISDQLQAEVDAKSHDPNEQQAWHFKTASLKRPPTTPTQRHIHADNLRDLNPPDPSKNRSLFKVGN